MSKELRAAAERLRKTRAANEISQAAYMQSRIEEYGADDDYGQELADEGLVIDAYLSEHPEDEDEPVTKEFVRHVGTGKRDDKECVIRQLTESQHLSVQILWESDWTKKLWRCVVRIYGKGIGDSGLVECKTCGDVRRLCKALGIELKESKLC